MVMDGREKKYFSAARDILKKEQQRTADLKQRYASYIVDLACAIGILNTKEKKCF